jgi:hypothetical protein
LNRIVHDGPFLVAASVGHIGHVLLVGVVPDSG